MPNKKVSLLDRARGDLSSARLNLLYGTEDVNIDIAAYSCSQCAEKIAKYVIALEGKKYAIDHRTDEYLVDMDNEDLKRLIEGASAKLDSWSTTIRYAGRIKSNRKSVEEVIKLCEKMLEIAQTLEPTSVDAPPEFSVQNNLTSRKMDSF